MNILTKKPVNVTVAYVPRVWAKFEAILKKKAAAARAKVLRRILALVFRDLMLASHFIAELTVPNGATFLACPRVILYTSDQPEERDLLFSKRH